MALVDGGFLHYTDIKKFLKNLLRNRLSDFEKILQESGFDISGARRASKIFGPLSSIRVFIADTGIFEI